MIKLGLLPWKEIIVGVAVAAALFMGYRLWSDTTELKLLRHQVKEDARVISNLTEVSTKYAADLNALYSRPAPTSPVRLCKPKVVHIPAPAGPGTPASGVVPGGTGEDPEEGGVEPGPDIRPDLNALILRAEEVSAQARAAWELSHAK